MGTWRPGWVIEGRHPVFLPKFCGAHRLWPGLPGVDCLRLGGNEALEGPVADLNLCFVGEISLSDLKIIYPDKQQLLATSIL